MKGRKEGRRTKGRKEGKSAPLSSPRRQAGDKIDGLDGSEGATAWSNRIQAGNWACLQNWLILLGHPVAIGGAGEEGREKGGIETGGRRRRRQELLCRRFHRRPVARPSCSPTRKVIRAGDDDDQPPPPKNIYCTGVGVG